MGVDSTNGSVGNKSPCGYLDRTIGYNNELTRLATVQKRISSMVTNHFASSNELSIAVSGHDKSRRVYQYDCTTNGTGKVRIS